MKITFCIPSKNNLRYLKNSVQSIKNNSEIEHDIVVFLDADNDGTEAWLIENEIVYVKSRGEELKGIAYGYNRCIEAAKTDIVCMFHADMYMAKGFDVAILKHLAPKKVVSGTRIEPPLHPEGREKIVKHFGMYPEDFQEAEFTKYCEALVKENNGKVTKGIFAPWACYKEDIMSIGMHDEHFHSYHEDSDMFNRFILNGYEIVQTWEGLVYHLTCRGGQFQDGIEKVTQDPAFHQMKASAMKNYLRKWGSWIKNDEYQYPILAPKYNLAYVVHNCNIPLLEVLEPWCDRIYVDERFTIIGRAWDYVEVEQDNTKFDLSKRVLTIKANSPADENDIVIEFDAAKFTNQSYNLLQQLPQIIAESGEVGEFELDIFKIKIIGLNTYENSLIINSDPYYTDQLL
jgi:glycosyltransferase involved in cell wall biosynthesis